MKKKKDTKSNGECQTRHGPTSQGKETPRMA